MDSPTEVDGPVLSSLLGREDQRRIEINHVQANKFMSNYISTAKYSIFSFLYKFLFEQFRRYANIFFLSIGLLQQIKNVSPTGRYVTIVPFTIILILTAIKEIIEDYQRHLADRKVNQSYVLVLNEHGSWESKQWQHVKVGDIVKVENEKFFPADLLLLASSEPQGMCYIETSNLDGETNLKIRSASPATFEYDTTLKIHDEFKGHIECENPNRHLYDFKGNITVKEEDGRAKTTPLDPSSILLRGAKLMNTKWIFGIVIYTGHESKLLMNSTSAPLKRSTIDKITNSQITFLFGILIFISIMSASANELLKKQGEDHGIYIGILDANSFFYNCLTFLILYNNLIPISLQVTLEFVKFIQAHFINCDFKMYHAETQTWARARTSNLNEELGQVEYVFSDKTGTLTRNIMEFKKSSIAGTIYSTSNESSESQSNLIYNLDHHHQNEKEIDMFLTLMAVCHTVIPEKREGQLFYNASSPDEKALVEGAAKYGYVFKDRSSEHVVIKTYGGKEKQYEVLNVIEFTSERKRMSVIVKTPKDEIVLLCKGADTMILERLGKSKDCRLYEDITIKHLEEFANDGLRTLCLGMKVIDSYEYEEWAKLYHSACTDILNKEEKIAEAAEEIENNLVLLGATAIEDKLQEGVPETIAQLLEANIHVWILTGDKMETAINIGHSCKLIKEEMPLILINQLSLEEVKNEIEEQFENFRNEGAVGRNNKIALVIDGKALGFALDSSVKNTFLDLCQSCRSVICCRVSPMQKAEVVELVQEKTKAISLAIGDGANDVAMIQKAHVGVGISGNEGLQAANSSDFAIAQFRFLSRLLLVHGSWNYMRISKVILYSFYKNICLYIIELWFGFSNYWSGQVLFERWTIGMYNIFFTSLPPIAIGLFDQFCCAKTRSKYPQLYHSTQKSEYFNLRTFWFWMFTAIMHSVFLYFLPMYAYKSLSVWKSGLTGDYLVIGNIVYTLVVITVCCKAGLEMDSFNIISHIFIWGSIGAWFAFLIIYSYFWPIGLPLAANMAGMVELIFSTGLFWLTIILIPFITLMPDVTYKIVKTTVFTTETDRIRMAEAKNRDTAPYITDQEETIQSSTLLRNVRKLWNKHSKRRKREEVELSSRGYAFSQEEHGVVSQTEFIRRKSHMQLNQTDSSKFGELVNIEEESRFNSPKHTSPIHTTPQRLKARKTELERPQSPILINVTKTRTKKSYAQNNEEIKPLSED